LRAAERTWEEGFEVRCAAGDFGIAGAIIERVAAKMPAEADVLRALHHERLAAARAKTAAETALVRAEVDTARRRGFLDEDSWRDVTVVLDRAEMPLRADLGAVARELAAVTARCAERRVLELASFTEEYAAKRAVPGVAERTEEIDHLVELGDLATARDVIARAEIGDEPPALAETSTALAEFFPALPSAVPGGLDPRHIAAAGAGGAIVGVSFAGLSSGERNVAKRGLQAWHDVTTKERSNSWVVPLAPALRILGIEADSSRNPALPGGADRRWVDFTGVRRTGKALVPAFGSATGSELRVLLCWNSPEVTTLLGWIAQDASEKPVVVLYFATLSPERRLALATALRERRSRPVVIVDDAALLYLAAYGASRFDATMRLALPFSAVNPYEPYAAGDVPVEMFYGRSLERSSITDLRGTSLIYGGRQLGKSALLRSAAGRFEQTRGYKALYVTLQSAPIATTRRPEAVWEVLKEALNIPEFTTRRLPKKDAAAVVQELIEGWLAADGNRRLLLLLDECDDFFDADAEHGFSQTARVRDLMARTGRRVKAVFAGLHQVQRFASIPNQPLAHLGEPQMIGPLAPQPAFDLLHGPLDALGFRLGEAQAARLMANANYQPLALQLYGRALLSLMLGKPVTGSLPVDVTDADVDAVLSNPTLDEQIRQCFELTLRLDPRYRVIAYTVAYRAHEAGHDSAMTTRELRSECETWWKEGFAQLGPDEFRSLVEEMVGLGVLAAIPDGWRMRSPNVLRMLGGIERVEEVLAEAESQAAPSGLFAAETRRVLDPDSGRRSPLTEMQLAELVSSATGRTHVVLGSTACGVDDVRDALVVATTGVGRAQLREAKSKATYHQLLRSGEPGEHRIIVSVPDAKDEACEAALEAALSTAPAEKTVRSVILVIGSQNLPWWPAVLERPDADVSVTELRRHSARSLWVWAVEVPSAFQDDQSRIRLLTITGGWPVLVDRAAQLAREGYAQPEIFAALEADLGGVAGAARLVDAVGLDADEELTALWNMLNELVDEPVAFEDLVALADSHPHPAGAVAALRALGVLAVTAAGMLHPEPVFRAAWHRVRG
ncbi:MAG TPA: hypothetical protein VK217_08185, partial [Acidimicrobiales bacterium]|nr:hypothetical protein [Acidimicrobiales bacterium]